MPIYEYQCAACHHLFDLMQKMSEAPVKTCPKCAEEQAVRLVSAAGFQLKGSGWYATDFKTKKPEQVSQSTDSQPAAESKKADTPPVTTSGSDT